jgi:hypothetical protein
MIQGLEIQKRCICLRNNNEIWISNDTYQKIKIAKENATGSILLHISELDRDVNTADIVEICTVEQMNDKRLIETGQRKCGYGNWHDKRFTCKCHEEEMERMKEADRKREDEERNRPLTKEELIERRRILAKTRKSLEKTGFFKDK